jgi:predicted phosphodiesterase
MRVAALYDIHGMLAPLEAVLAELDGERIDAVVLGGDVVGGPQPAEVLARLDEVEVPLVWIRGNGERALGPDAADATGAEAALEFTRAAVAPERAERLAALATAVPLEVDGLGDVLFCHATPSDDDVLITTKTPDEVLRRAAEGVEQRTIVCGHTHMQYDRTAGGIRWVNAGAVGMPYEGEVAAFWAVLGPDVEFRRTPFDIERAMAEIAASGWPDARPFIEENLKQAVSREEATAYFEGLARERGER